MSNQVVDFEDNSHDFELPLLAELDGQIVIVESAKFDSSSYGKYAVIGLTIEGQDKAGTQFYRSGGAAILNQLERMKEKALDHGQAVRALVNRPEGKRYYVFTVPK